MGHVTHAHPTYVSPADALFDEKLGKDAWRRPIHNPLTYTEKANIYNAKSAIKVGVYSILTPILHASDEGLRVRIGVRVRNMVRVSSVKINI